MQPSKTVRLFLADGTQSGVTTGDIGNWSGRVLRVHRTKLRSLVQRAEIQRPGVYFLVTGDPESIDGVTAYIGESSNVATRLKQQEQAKDFWNWAIVVTSMDSYLTKAHAKHLESKLISLAVAARRCTLTNDKAPPIEPLPEADVSDMESFIEHAKLLLAVLGIDILRSAGAPHPTETLGALADPADQSPVFRLTANNGLTDASAQELDGEFTVRERSVARSEQSGANNNYSRLFAKLVADGSIACEQGSPTGVFTRDVVFASPSAAAAVVLGRSANGRVEWKVDGTRTTYGQWQENLLEPDSL